MTDIPEKPTVEKGELDLSPYARVGSNLRENGYHVIPIKPGTQIPGQYKNGQWRPMPGWTKYCDTQAAPFVHDQWETWPEANVCIAHGAVIGLDLDSDDAEIATAIYAAHEPSMVRRRGSKGWMAYYRQGPGLEEHTARVRWYDKDGAVRVELLLHGTQSVLPPSIHPKTNRPYKWLVATDTLENTDISELPEFGGAELAALDRELTKIGLSKQAPRRVRETDFERSVSTDHDLEKPMGRSVNDRAMESIDVWWPELDMPKTRQRGPGAWEAVPFWRDSSQGRPLHDRNPNLKAVTGGIVDFGADRSYTPIDVVMAARDCSVATAMDWLGGYIRPERGAGAAEVIPPEQRVPPCPEAAEVESVEPGRWGTLPVFPGTRSYRKIKPIAPPSAGDWDKMLPRQVPDFPIQEFSVCDGLLGDLAAHIDSASVTATEAGALAVALPVLGAVMGRHYESATGLRTNIYSVALGGSGRGKTSLVNPAKEIMRAGGVANLIGQDRIASGPGLLKMLTVEPRRVCFLDEFGHMLQQIGLPGTGMHAKQILTEFTALFSAANTIFTGTAYATQEPAQIDCPNLCLFGMATPEQFWRAFGSSHMEDGSIARYLVFPLGDTAPKAMDVSATEEVADAIVQLQAAISERARGNLGHSPAVTVPMNEAAEKQRAGLKEKETAFADYAEKQGVKGAAPVLRRVTENAIKIALISAVGRNVDRPEIDGRDMEIGHALAWWSANVMISNISSHIADNQHERDVNDVERFIQTGGDKGRLYRDVQRKFRRIKSRDLRDILEALERQGSVRFEGEQNPNGGPLKKTFFPI